MKPIKKILCPVDIYDFQPEAAEYAMTLAKALDAEISVLYAFEPLPPRYFAEGYVFYSEENEKKLRQEAEAKMAEIMTCFCSICQDKAVVVVGDAAEQIIKIATESSVDMIVMASHGRSALGRVIYGSVTNKVLADTKIPVLVIKPSKE